MTRKKKRDALRRAHERKMVPESEAAAIAETPVVLLRSWSTIEESEVFKGLDPVKVRRELCWYIVENNWARDKGPMLWLCELMEEMSRGPSGNEDPLEMSVLQACALYARSFDCEGETPIRRTGSASHSGLDLVSRFLRDCDEIVAEIQAGKRPAWGNCYESEEKGAGAVRSDAAL